MNFIRKNLDKIKKPFEKGGKLEKFYPAFDAFETFLFVPNHTTKSGAHIRDAVDLKRTMVTVIIALIPALIYGIYNTGYQYSATGSGVTANGNLSPGTGAVNVTIDGVTSSWTGVTSKPQFVQTNPGAAFQFTETYSGPGMSNQTIIQRETTITSITDSTSIFQQ